MVKCMKEVVKLADTDLSVEERNLLSVAFKNVIGAKRSSWRTLQLIENKEDKEDARKSATTFREKVENELKDVCGEVLELLDKTLIPRAKEVEDAYESQVFYLKM